MNVELRSISTSRSWLQENVRGFGSHSLTQSTLRTLPHSRPWSQSSSAQICRLKFGFHAAQARCQNARRNSLHTLFRSPTTTTATWDGQRGETGTGKSENRRLAIKSLLELSVSNPRKKRSSLATHWLGSWPRLGMAPPIIMQDLDFTISFGKITFYPSSL
jgi:hypothetical protein